jgi:erythromycin esterase-like protein
MALLRAGSQVLGDRDYDALLSMAGGRTFVLLGEASHGTHEHHEEVPETWPSGL